MRRLLACAVLVAGVVALALAGCGPAGSADDEATATTAAPGGDEQAAGATTEAAPTSGSTSCRPDRRTGRTVMRVYRDGLGDDSGPGDIETIRISDRAGVVTVEITVRDMAGSASGNMTYGSLAWIEIDTDCDGGTDVAFSVGYDGGGGAWEQREAMPGGEYTIGPEGDLKVTRTHDTYAFRFASAAFGGVSAFRFSAYLQTFYENPELSQLEQSAPFSHEAAPNDGSWSYDLTSR